MPAPAVRRGLSKPAGWIWAHNRARTGVRGSAPRALTHCLDHAKAASSSSRPEGPPPSTSVSGPVAMAPQRPHQGARSGTYVGESTRHTGTSSHPLGIERGHQGAPPRSPFSFEAVFSHAAPRQPSSPRLRLTARRGLHDSTLPLRPQPTHWSSSDDSNQGTITHTPQPQQHSGVVERSPPSWVIAAVRKANPCAASAVSSSAAASAVRCWELSSDARSRRISTHT